MYAILTSAMVFGLSMAAHAGHKHTSPNRTSLSRRALSGPATHYEGNMDGACQMTGYTIPEGLYGTALAVSNWENSYNCGGCVLLSISSIASC